MAEKVLGTPTKVVPCQYFWNIGLSMYNDGKGFAFLILRYNPNCQKPQTFKNMTSNFWKCCDVQEN